MCGDRSIEPRLLIIETSGRRGEVGAARGGRIEAVRRLDEGRRHARDLAPAIVDLCAQLGWKVRDMEGVIVSRGPGSYTGLRVGVMTAKTLAYATGCLLFAIDTFAAIAHQAPPEAERLDVLADAQQGKLYVQRYRRAGGECRAETELTICAKSDWLARLTPEIWITGPGLSVVEAELRGEQPRATEDERQPAAASLLALGIARWRAGAADDLWTLEPLYLRPSNAEINWDRRTRSGPPEAAT